MRWVKQYSPAMAYVLPLGDQHRPAYNQFVNLLADKNVYATAAWTTPTSSQTSNVLFFMMNGVLTGAFFPLTGIPDMPKPFGSNTAPVTEQRRFALTGQAFPGMPGGGPASTGMVPAGGAGPGGMSGGGPNRLAQGQQLLPLGDVVANFPQYVSMVKARFPTGHATAELKAKLVDDLRRLQMLQQAQKAAAAPWDASGGMGGPAGGNHGGAGMSNVGQNPGMPNMGNNPAAMQNMAAMAAMGMGMGGMGGMNPVNSSNNAGNAGGAGAQGFNFMNAGMNMGFGHGGS
ncbi:hypothetical protein BKA70DRAFT_717200 [Coprinopsis sp. MPI-PUGE-AT-0042]|nr:hypothetical protein BKA70DRAFT_717200 [Coprinopsis sp. MPI-PUGE-AT-0042]